MLTRLSVTHLSPILATLLGLSLVWGGANAEEGQDDYLALVKQRAAQAKAAGDVQGMIRCAYALYPVEAFDEVKEKQCQGLLNAAADAVLAKKQATEAARFLDLTAPLTTVFDADRQKKVAELALGESQDEFTRTKAQQASEPLAKYGKDLADPDVKLRGSITRDVAEAVGMAVLVFCRPSCVLSEKQPYMRDYGFSRPRSDRLELRVSLVFYGCFSGNRYDAVVRVVLDLDPIEVLYIRYTDDNLVPRNNDPNAITDAINDLLASR